MAKRSEPQARKPIELQIELEALSREMAALEARGRDIEEKMIAQLLVVVKMTVGTVPSGDCTGPSENCADYALGGWDSCRSSLNKYGQCLRPRYCDACWSPADAADDPDCGTEHGCVFCGMEEGDDK